MNRFVDFPTPDVSQNKDRMMPLQEAEFSDSLMQVGQSLTFNSSFSWELICFANDANGLYFNNKGVLNVTVTRLSWPPLKGGFKVGNVTKWPLYYRWPPQAYLEIEGYQGDV